MRIAILAYGSLISDPGDALQNLIVDRRDSRTPFRIEYARKSKSRGNAPVLVPVESGGGLVDAKLLVLRAGLTLQEAKNQLFWREIHSRRGDRPYTDLDDDDPNRCRIEKLEPEEVQGANQLDIVITTRFGVNLHDIRIESLAGLAMQSVQTASQGKDGISYLRDNIRCGIETPLTGGYHTAILRMLGASDLDDALQRAKDGFQPAAG